MPKLHRANSVDIRQNKNVDFPHPVNGEDQVATFDNAPMSLSHKNLQYDKVFALLEFDKGDGVEKEIAETHLRHLATKDHQ